MMNALDQARTLLTDGDVPGAVRALRPLAETAPITELAAFTTELAAAVDFDDLVQAARAVIGAPEDAQALVVFGYECIERGISFLAVPVLREALRRQPDSQLALNELTTALEDEYRHGEAVAALTAHAPILRPWPERYLLTYNLLLSGQVAAARTEFDTLPDPEDERWFYARDRVGRMLSRADRAATVSPLDHQDLRGWHFALNGGYLATYSPYGFDAGMTGRWAYLGDSVENCRRGLDRLALILTAAGRTPRSVSLLPNRSDRILGLAAAQLLDLPTVEYDPDRTDTAVIAYHLNTLPSELQTSLLHRADGQILHEHASCWTDPTQVSADVHGLLAQTVVEPWGPRFRIGDNGPEDVPGDDRPEAELAAEIVAADTTPDPGDGATPDDPDSALAAFVTATRDSWLQGPRSPARSPGPVRSSRFF
ncbi:hypothetical protein [Nocardia yamanashiensis]|uniref:hypothetical protein n=1 Tax=Nocardia yamanashiensis TaxID=209247 RepID=UPI0008369186|nr:hypothetical protein [Nocardia yamanashiensis]